MEFLPEIIQEYAERHTDPEPPILAELNRETNLKVLYPRMLSGHLQGRFLSMMAKVIRPTRILEIGSYTGYSALCLAEGLAPEGTITTLEIDPELEDMIRDYFERAGESHRLDLRIGNAVEIIPTLEGPFDLVFIDADKYNYTTYFELILPKLRPGGVIFADNVLWSGQVTDPNVQDKETQGLREFANFVSSDPRVERILLPIRDGIMMIMKK
jgi:predicted O-methyltransferase YrrM